MGAQSQHARLSIPAAGGAGQPFGGTAHTDPRGSPSAGLHLTRHRLPRLDLNRYAAESNQP